ncbi:hypothetical protein [Spiroplasma endosymbiont of 'Nebria riversi']|uniref:hypothetical protein n=1 Tax=Spiroplasma endosymbiont of 'Nebria riversi' TaxID=2792084 RepID=UPI001C05DFBA|nr:hypothetical protein [Spiroplasma endosymbiont of 'Nebria riversi']
MRKASYVDTNIDYAPNEELKNIGRGILKQWEKQWKGDWFDNLTKEKQKEYKLITNKLALENKKAEFTKLRNEWKRNWFVNLDKEKQREYKKRVE